jgi:hypothetical protein
LIGRLLPSPQRPQWAILTADALLCGYVGDERTLSYYSNTLGEWKPRKIERRTLEADIAHRAELWQGDFRAAVAPARIGEFIAAAKPARWVADAAFGIVLGDGDETSIMSAANAVGGSVSFSRSERWFDVPAGPQRALLERLKQSFDPDRRLALLPWQTA